MSEIINLIPDSPDIDIYLKAVEIVCQKIDVDYSFVLQIWNKEIPETKYKKVLILTSDEQHQIPTHHFDKNVQHIFKQYMPMKELRNPDSVLNIPKITPLPLGHLRGITHTNIPINDRKLDWCWMGQYDPYSRVDFKHCIDNLCTTYDFKNECLWYNGWNNGFDKSKYSDILNDTKIALVPVGSASIETFRFFESMMCGCVVISVQQPRTYFYNEARYIKVEQWDYQNIAAIIKNIIQNKKLIQELSELSVRWYDMFCSPAALAKYMIGALGV